MDKYLCYALRSRLPTKEPSFIILADFDDVSFKKVEKSAREQIEKRHLSDFFIVKNSDKQNYYHLHCPTKVNYEEYEQILLEFNENGMDSNFMYPFYNWDNRTTVLRFHSPEKGKLKVVKTIKSKYRNEREMNLGYLRFLRDIFKVDITKYTNTDNNELLTIDEYFTEKR